MKYYLNLYRFALHINKMISNTQYSKNITKKKANKFYYFLYFLFKLFLANKALFDSAGN